eukprot:CAMPEP_0119310902 /NCGR_PEP_ID=MMETSP1333-20130426/20739_1 /TAXON_ID=418940 /ORGANISM="Scyphosphaera apsteinii, Strain RCC1455" /LENGTH=328 /DNA_ID=CAMNT_0007315165 /DNA_START=22 /DNA_END=1008 /DNA_ORIENTATION=+
MNTIARCRMERRVGMLANARMEAGLNMLADACMGEFEAAYGTICKIFQNIIYSPDEEKYRRLRVTNNKVAALLATKGVRALLVGAGFVEEAGALVLPSAAELVNLRAALVLLQALATERAQSEADQKALEQEKGKEATLQVGDDCQAQRRWTGPEEDEGLQRAIALSPSNAVARQPLADCHAQPAIPPVGPFGNREFMCQGSRKSIENHRIFYGPDGVKGGRDIVRASDIGAISGAAPHEDDARVDGRCFGGGGTGGAASPGRLRREAIAYQESHDRCLQTAKNGHAKPGVHTFADMGRSEAETGLTSVATVLARAATRVVARKVVGG